MLVIKTVVRKDDYRDSVMLMRISKELEELEGVEKASAMMGTDNNKQMLKDAGLYTDEAIKAGPNDLIIVVDAVSEVLADQALSKVDELLAVKREEKGEITYKTLSSALSAMPDANFVIISTPGEFAAREAMRGLNAGKHVMIFSDAVPLQEEVELKKIAYSKKLLLLGPGAGTSIIDGVGLGFANVVKRGPIGVVGAAGTGIQEVTRLIDVESGITHALGVGGRDLSLEVGGLGTLGALRFLAADPETKVILIVAKAPTTSVAEIVLKAAEETRKPVVACLLGASRTLVTRHGATYAATLADAAAKAVALVQGKKPKEVAFTAPRKWIEAIVKRETENFAENQKYIRGLFSGGTLCTEAMLILRELVGDVYSNIPLDPRLKLPSTDRSEHHTCIDMGTEEFTRGVPHPMIFFKPRCERLLREAKDREVAVVLLDVVLGYGANPDPAGELAGAIAEAKKRMEKSNGYLSIVASVCGTAHDPQGFEVQKKKLEDVGVVVMPSNAEAARIAALIATRGKVGGKLK
jgi:succinyl-CoA synthetase alpha subunit